ncbi:MAG: hypothetical protein ACE15C_19025 [Phycisphaerae bacterium]
MAASLSAAAAIALAVAGASPAARAQDVSQPASAPAFGDGDLTRVIEERPVVPITDPDGPRRPAAPQVVLPREHSSVINRRGTLLHDTESDWFILKFDDAGDVPDDTQRWVLPCAYLEEMEKQVARNPSARFRVSGETFIYQGRAFLLPQKVMVEAVEPEVGEDKTPASSPSALPVPTPAATMTASSSSPATQTATTKPTGPAASRPAIGGQPVSPQEIIRMMERDKPARAVFVAVDTPEPATAPSVAPARAVELPASKSTYVADRLVRITEQKSTWWTAVFESDNNLQEPPLRLAPCLSLHRAEILVTGGVQPHLSDRGMRDMRKRGAMGDEPKSIRFRISGEILTYKGCRYLLLRKCMLDWDMGQF